MSCPATELDEAIYSCDPAKKEAAVISTKGSSVLLMNTFFSPVGFTTYSVTSIVSAKEVVPNTLKSVVIPENVRIIRKNAFIDCRSLMRVDFERLSRLETIEEAAFCRCWSIESFTVPKSVITIGGNAFIGCIHLKDLLFEEDSSLRELGAYALAHCRALISVEVPSTVTHVGIGVLFQCPSLQRVKLGSNFDHPLIRRMLSDREVFVSIEPSSLRQFRKRKAAQKIEVSIV